MLWGCGWLDVVKRACSFREAFCVLDQTAHRMMEFFSRFLRPIACNRRYRSELEALRNNNAVKIMKNKFARAEFTHVSVCAYVRACVCVSLCVFFAINVAHVVFLFEGSE